MDPEVAAENLASSPTLMASPHYRLDIQIPSFRPCVDDSEDWMGWSVEEQERFVREVTDGCASIGRITRMGDDGELETVALGRAGVRMNSE